MGERNDEAATVQRWRYKLSSTRVYQECGMLKETRRPAIDKTSLPASRDPTKSTRVLWQVVENDTPSRQLRATRSGVTHLSIKPRQENHLR